MIVGQTLTKFQNHHHAMTFSSQNRGEYSVDGSQPFSIEPLDLNQGDGKERRELACKLKINFISISGIF